MKKILLSLIIMILVPGVYALTGDINNDGIVDGADLSILVDSFGSVQGDWNYNSASDLTGSGKVDGDDLSVLAAHFGNTGQSDSLLYLITESSEASDIDSTLADPVVYDERYGGVRYKYVVLADEVTGKKDIQTGTSVYVNCFDDVVYRAVIDSVTTNVNNTLSVTGRFEDFHYSYFISTTTDNVTLATITIPEMDLYYEVIPDITSNQHILMEFDTGSSGMLRNAEPLIPPPETFSELLQQKVIAKRTAAENAGPQDHANIDMMIVYTPAAAEWASSRGGIQNIISQAMERTRITYDNSILIASPNLVHAAQVDYVESGSSYIDLYRLVTGPGFTPFGDTSDGQKITGFMDEVHRWRDSYGADLVAILAQVNDVGGLGFLLTTTAGRPQFGFSLTRVQQAGSSYTHVHETGHNMGAHHHKEQLVSPGPGLFSYSAGWRWTGNNGGRYCSVMTYEGGSNFADGMRHTSVAYFSHPNVNHFGVPTGHPQHGDNARTLREIKHVIAAYRTASGAPPQAPSHLVAAVSDTETIRLGWRDNSKTATGFNVYKRSAPDGEWVQIGSTGPSNRVYYDRGISFNQTYHYRVSAFNGAGESAYSNTVEITVGMGW